MYDLEALRDIFRDDKLHIGIGTITQLGLSQDASKLRAQVNLLPEEREIVCEMSFMDVNIVSFPEIEDLVLVAFVDGHPDDAFIVRVLNSTAEPIPTFAQTGHTTVYPRAGKKLYLGSTAKIALSRPATEPSEPLALGLVLKTLLTNLILRMDTLINAAGIMQTAPAVICTAPGELGIVNPAWVTALAAIRTDLQADKTTYLDTASTNILSQLAFTERGV